MHLTIQQDISEEEQTGAPTIDTLKGSSVSWGGKEKGILAGSLAAFVLLLPKMPG